jgi:beta-galactosidase
MRRARGQCEKFHGAVIEHSGRSDTRVFGEIAALGKELQIIGDRILGSRTKARIALWFDWNSWWGTENSMGPNKDLNYLDQIFGYYKAALVQHFEVDFVGPDSDFSGYQILLAPLLYMIEEGLAQKIRIFVEKGGTLVTGFLSGVADRSDLVFKGGAPGPLKGILGLWVEETDALPPSVSNTICMNDKKWKNSYPCKMIFDLIRVEDAQVMGVYGKDFYAGRPVVTKKATGHGQAWYVASDAQEDFLRDLISFLCAQLGIEPVLTQAAEDVETAIRVGENGERFLFILNHGVKPKDIPLDSYECEDLLSGEKRSKKIRLESQDVFIGKILP